MPGLSISKKHEGIRQYSSSELDAISLGQNGFDVLPVRTDEYYAGEFGIKYWTEFKVMEEDARLSARTVVGDSHLKNKRNGRLYNILGAVEISIPPTATSQHANNNAMLKIFEKSNGLGNYSDDFLAAAAFNQNTSNTMKLRDFDYKNLPTVDRLTNTNTTQARNDIFEFNHIKVGQASSIYGAFDAIKISSPGGLAIILAYRGPKI